MKVDLGRTLNVALLNFKDHVRFRVQLRQDAGTTGRSEDS